MRAGSAAAAFNDGDSYEFPYRYATQDQTAQDEDDVQFIEDDSEVAMNNHDGNVVAAAQANLHVQQQQQQQLDQLKAELIALKSTPVPPATTKSTPNEPPPLQSRPFSHGEKKKESYWRTFGRVHKEVAKLVTLSLVIVFALAIHKLVTWGFQEYDIPAKYEVYARVAYPVIIIIWVWVMKAYVVWTD